MRRSQAGIPELPQRDVEATDVIVGEYIQVLGYEKGYNPTTQQNWHQWHVMMLDGSEKWVWGRGRKPMHDVEWFFSQYPGETLDGVMLVKDNNQWLFVESDEDLEFPKVDDSVDNQVPF